MNTKLTNEQIAHDLTVAICIRTFPDRHFINTDPDVDAVVQEYAILYDKVLKAVKATL